MYIAYLENLLHSSFFIVIPHIVEKLICVFFFLCVCL